MANYLKSLWINRVAHVDKGAGEGVRIVLAKRADDVDAGTLLLQKKFTLWHDGKTGNFTVEHDNSKVDDDKKKMKKVADGTIGEPVAHEALVKANDLLGKSIKSIIADEGAVDKAAMIEKSFSEYVKHVEAVTAGIAVEKTGDAHNKEAVMADEKTLEETKKALGDTEKLLKQARFDLAVAKMSKEDVEYMQKACATDKDKEDFAEMDEKKRAEKRASVTKSLPEDIQKRLDQFDVMQKRLDEITKREELEKFEKRATDLGFGAGFGETLQKAFHSGDAESVAKIEKEIGALRKQVAEGKLFSAFGKSTVQTGDAYGLIKAKADELRKADPKLSEAAAFTKAYENPANSELVMQYKAEKRAAQ
jgi:hypothetical protein